MDNNVANMINVLASNLFTSLDDNIYNILDDITFINSDILKDNFITKILGTSATSGLLLICNSLLFRFYFILFSFFNFISFNFF